MKSPPPAYRFDFVLVATYARSGSTLLTGLLNSIPGFLIRGENNNFTYPLYRAHQALLAAQTDPDTEDSDHPTHPWYGIRAIDLALFRRRCAELITETLIGGAAERPACLGFKEVRFHEPEIRYHEPREDLNRFLDFLRALFPRMAIIVNTRDFDEVRRSGWWADTPGKEVERLIKPVERRLLAYAAANPECCFTIDYADMTGRTDRLRALFDFLGAPYDADTIEHIMAEQHSTRTEHAAPPATTGPTTN